MSTATDIKNKYGKNFGVTLIHAAAQSVSQDEDYEVDVPYIKFNFIDGSVLSFSNSEIKPS